MPSDERERDRQGNRERRPRSTSRSRPTTPLRPSSRSSFRESARSSVQGDNASFPLNAFEPAFAELSDAMADLEANMMHFQLMHESLARFSESFASFLYGLNMNAFCVDFPEGPMAESFRRMRAREQEQQLQDQHQQQQSSDGFDGDPTFMTTDTSFVDNPPSVKKPAPKYSSTSRASRVPPPSVRGTASSTRGGTARGGARGASSSTRGTRGASTSTARGRGRGVR
ncbi:DASH complex subunit Dam1-domain-containing protein [Apiosordaria backusii]|uniref:DASH complex subunit DAM1 n=1 Tax=Apiosordaria backusii TaxID=314023 RepID=A0AA40ASW7_9PEZI|nr:DASH complex subunit Dam1-domain-containing protein [Apiosordaria backusii]